MISKISIEISNEISMLATLSNYAMEVDNLKQVATWFLKSLYNKSGYY